MGEHLVGRRWELRALVDLLAAAQSGHGRGLVLLGDAGIGKTTLAEAFAAEASGHAVGWGRCLEIEAMPYWPWRQVLQPLDAAAPLRPLRRRPRRAGRMDAARNALKTSRTVGTVWARDPIVMITHRRTSH